MTQDRGDIEARRTEGAAPYLTPKALTRLEEFRQAHRTQVLTIFLSDLVGSTQQQVRLGNVPAAELVQTHRAIFRETLAGFDGQEVETAGDSFLVAFATPSEAARFALYMQANMRREREHTAELPAVRVGIHQGQVVVERHDAGPKVMDVYGVQVSVAARIAELAGAGQVFCSRGVFDDARAVLRPEDFAGLGPIAWRNHGPYQFKGLEDRYDVCEVGEEGLCPLTAPAGTQKGWPAGIGEEELGWRPASGITVPGTSWVLQDRLGQVEPGRPQGANKGAFGEVWKAWNPGDQSYEVFKFCFRRDRLPALKREARLLKRLRRYRHPNLVEVYDVTEGDRPPYYLEMEYVDGPSLEEWMAAGPAMKDRLEVVAQVADALDVVHAAGIYHRDIKPSNLLLTRREDGALQAKLTDFGLGAAQDKRLLASISASRLEGVAGTWDYIAPELREGAAASAQSDLYSLGVTLYQLVLGDLRRPLTADWEAQVPSPVLAEDIRRCTTTDPAQRWRRAAELAQALRAHDQRLQSLALERERQEQHRRARRLRVVSGVVGLVAVVTMGLGGYAWYQRAQAERNRRAAVDSARTATQNERQAQHHRRQAEQQAVEARHQLGVALLERATVLDRDGRIIPAFLTAARAVGFEGSSLASEGRLGLLRPGSDEDLHARGLARKTGFALLWESPCLLHHQDPVVDVAFPPDGTTLVSADKASWCHFWDLGLADRTGIAHASWGGIECIAVSPDGLRAAWGNREGEVRLQSCREQRQELLCKLAGSVSCLAFGPDGQALATGRDNGKVRLWDLKERVATVLATLPEAARRVAFSGDGRTLAAADARGGLVLWDVPGKQTKRLFAADALAAAARAKLAVRAEQVSPDCVALGPDGRTVAYAATFKSGQEAVAAVCLLDAATGKLAHAARADAAVTSLRFGPAGKPLVIGGEDGTMRLWAEPAGGTAPGPALEGHDGAVRCIAFARDARRLASGGDDWTVRLWDVSEKGLKPLTPRLGGHTDTVVQLGFHPDGKLLASVGASQTLHLWDAQTGRHLLHPRGEMRGVTCAGFSPEAGSRLLATGTRQGEVRLWEVGADGKSVQAAGRFGTSGLPILSLRFRPDGKRLLCGHSAGAWALWEVSARRLVLSRQQVTQGAVAFSPNGQAVVTLRQHEGALHLWDLMEGRSISRLVGAADLPTSLAFSPDGDLLASIDASGAMHVWRWATGERMPVPLDGPETRAGALAFCPAPAPDPDSSRALLAVATNDGKVRLWDVAAARTAAVLEGHTRPLVSLAFSPDGRLLASGGHDHTIRVWDVSRADALVTRQVEDVWELGFSGDGRRVVLSGGIPLRLWHVQSLAIRTPLEGKLGGLPGRTALSPDGGDLAIFHHQSPKIELWDLEIGVRTNTLETSSGAGHLSFSPDGRLLAAGTADGQIDLWKFSRLGVEPTAHFGRAHGGNVSSLSFAPDGGLLASGGSDDGRVRLWDTSRGQLKPLTPGAEGHAKGVSCVRFSPLKGARLLASAGREGHIRLWDAQTLRPIRTIEGHAGVVTGLSFSPDGRLLASGGVDGTVRLWQMPGGEPLAWIERETCAIRDVAFSPTQASLAWITGRGKLCLWRMPPVRSLSPGAAAQFRFSGLDVEPARRNTNLYGHTGSGPVER